MSTIQQAGDAPKTLAAIDLGSNSFHMIVYRYHKGHLQLEDRLREPVRLAAGLDHRRVLNSETRQLALACLERFAQRVRNLPRESVRVVGTNTLRMAKNADEFILAAEQALGQPIEIIAGVEEARLIYLGVAHSTKADKQRRLVMDIGGGSTELIVGEDFKPRLMQSLYMGCLSMTRRYFADGSINRKAIKQAEIAARMELEPIAATYRKSGWQQAIGASGTIRAVDKVVREAGWSQEGISLDALLKTRDALLEAGHIQTLTLKGLSEERAPVFPGGLMVLLATFKALKIEHMQVSDGALREGLIHDLFDRVQHEDVRSRAIISLASRYHADEAQAQRVFDTACTILKQAAKSWKMDTTQARQWLDWAARIHEIGLDIAHSQYHKHGAYIAEFADLAGFSRQEQLFLASLVRMHRRKFSPSGFNRLSSDRARLAQRLAIVLRLAVLLHRSRSPEPLPNFSARASKQSLAISFPEGWLDSHRLTEADLQQEREYLQISGFELSYT